MDAVIRTASAMPVQEMGVETDTRDYLAHARAHAREAGYADWTIVDIDAHHVETVHWHEIIDYIEDPVLRHQATMYHRRAALRPQRRSRPALPGRRRAHSAPVLTAREGGRSRRAS